MISKDKKMAVFDLLKLENEPISLPELLLKLGSQYSERTVRRWLQEWAINGKIEISGQKRGTKYRLIQDEAIAPISGFQEENTSIIARIRKPLYERVSVAYNDQWFAEYEPNHTFYISLNLRNQLYEAGKRTKEREPAGTYAHRIFNRLLIDLSFNSSRLEGNTYSLLDTQRLLLEGKSAEGKLDEERVMILNHKEAIRYLIDNAVRLSVNEQTIFTLHFLLSEGLLEPHESGRIRGHGVRIGGSTYIPFENKHDLQVRLSRILQKGEKIEDPYEQSLFLLVHLSYLQTFADVNKRTARLSANIPLIKHNLVPLSFNDVQRDDYASAMLAIYELQEVGPLIDLYHFSYLRTCSLYDSTIQAVGFDEIRVKYRQQRRQILREIILKKLKGQSLFSYIDAEVTQLIYAGDRASVRDDILDDLREMDITRIAGLGVTSTELKEWQSIQDNLQ